MKKNKLILIGVFILFISLFVNIALFFNLTYVDENISENVNDFEAVEDELIINNTSPPGEFVSGSKANQVITDFFRIYYDYTSETYESRYENIKRYVSEEVYGQLTSAGIPSMPNIEISNEIVNLEFYLTDAEEMRGLVLLDTMYSIEGLKNPIMTQVFRIVVENDNGNYYINYLEVVGTFSDTLTES
ncbi:putative aldehyde dehydrogenase [Bacillus sp. TS-2]|nr:putative aldehyde dehydrogenase [Bacillus sp. TS-2]